MVTHPSQSAVSDPGSSASQRVQAVNSSPVSPGLLHLWTLRKTGLMNGGTIGKATGWMTGKTTGTGTVRRIA